MAVMTHIFKCCSIVILAALSAVGHARGADAVWVVDLEGALGPAKADFIVRTITDAELAGAAAVVIRMDTPGGLDASMRGLVKKILAAQVPVVTYVAPNGARAASAGTYIAYASHIAAMAPATNIGSSTPISIGAPPSLPEFKPGQKEPPGGTEPDSDESVSKDDTGREVASSPTDHLTNKVINDAVAYLQGLAELRGRNVAWAEETVRHGTNIRASVALSEGVIDLLADDLQALLEQIDGRQIKLQDREVTLQVKDADVVHVQPDWQHDLLEVITDPTIAYALLVVGIWGLILEFYSPGLILPSVLGVVCLLLGAYGLQMLPVNYAGVALILLGICFMVVEIITPAIGVFGITGVVAFAFGSLMLMDTQAQEYQLPVSIIAGFTVVAASLTLLAAGFALRARSRQVVTGIDVLIGAKAEVVEDFTEHFDEQQGRVFVASELWRAHAARVPDRDLIKKGDVVAVSAVEDLELTVTEEV